jgi:cell division protein FtsL
MTRLGAVFWFIVVLAAGFTTFKVKYAVQDLEDQLNRVRRQAIAEQQEIRVLNAEWTYLTQPERLADLNRRFLGLAPIAPKQLQRNIADIPLRPPAAPPDELVDVATMAPGADQPVAPNSADPVSAGMTTSQTPMPAIQDVLAAAPTPPPPQATAANSGLQTTPSSLDELVAQAALPVTPAVLARVPAQPPLQAQLAKAGPAAAPRSLDALIALIADKR